MRKRNLSVKLASIVRVTLGLMLGLQQSPASDQREEEETLQTQRFSETEDTEQKAPEASYGDFDILSEDILFHQLLPHCDRTIIQVNRSFFTLVTGYDSDGIFDQGFESKPTKPTCCLRGYTIFDFIEHQHHIEQMLSFVWYSLIREIKNIPSSYWSYLKGSQIHTVILWRNHIGADGTRDFGQCLQGTQVHTVDLSENQIGDNGVRDFVKSLRGTQVQTVNLSYNKIRSDGAQDFGQSLQGTQVQTVYLNYNQIGDDGVRNFGQSLKGTQVQTVDLSYNKIGDHGVRDFGQSLQGTQVYTVVLRFNQIGDEGAEALAQALKNTKIQTLDLLWNPNYA